MAISEGAPADIYTGLAEVLDGAGKLMAQLPGHDRIHMPPGQTSLSSGPRLAMAGSVLGIRR